MAEPAPPRLRAVLGSQYFIYFGVLGVYLPYFNLYCYHIGFSGFQIGLISTVRTLATALFPMLWGQLADRYRIRKPIFVACSFAGALVWSLFLTTTEFPAMLAIMAIYGFFYAPIISFLEAFTMDFLGSRRRDYGRLRAWGSISFIAVVTLAGLAIDETSLRIVPALILAGSLLRAAFSTQMPPSATTGPRQKAAGLRLLCRPPVAGFLAAAFLMLVSHGAYYAFFSIHLDALGFGRTTIGVCWAIAVGAEIVVMFFSRRLFARFSLQAVLVFSFSAAAIRWFVLANTESLAVILVCQLLHAFTYGAFHMASVLRIDELMPPEAKTVGQAANNAVTYGLGMMVGFFGSGLLYAPLGSFALFAVSGLTAAAGAAVLVMFRPRASSSGRFCR
jgi:PPP family 3-phenylpropionic acid transporter